MTTYINGISSNTTAITEDVATTDAANVKTNLTGSQVWVAASFANAYNQSAIQIIVNFDKDVMVYIDQSIDGTNAIPGKTYSWIASANVGLSRSVASIAPYYRIRLTNLSAAAATGSMVSAATAILNVLPESLDINGNLKLGTLTDVNNMIAQNTPQGEMRTITPFRLVGAQMDMTANAGVVDPNYWSTFVNTTGTVTVSNSLCSLSSGVGAAGSAKISSIRRARYVTGYTNRLRANMRMSTNQVSNTKRFGVGMYSNYTFTVTGSPTAAVGDIYSNNSQIFIVTQPCAAGATLYCNGTGAPAAGNLVRVSGAGTNPIVVASSVADWVISDGAFFQMAEAGTFTLEIYKNGSPTHITTFNGQRGTVYVPNSDIHTYEIYYTNTKIYFVEDEYLIHTYYATTSSWTATMNMYIYAENINSGNTTNTTLGLRNAGLHRLGLENTQPLVYNFPTGQSAGVVLKYGAGNIRGLTVNSATNNAVVTLYDGITNAFKVITSWTFTASSVLPAHYPLYGITFSNGLTLEVKTQNAAITVFYE